MLFNILTGIFYNPVNKGARLKALVRFFKWQLFYKSFRTSLTIKYLSKSKLIIHKNFTASTGTYYNGLFEFEIMAFALKFLRKEDLFVDIGANAGTFTLIGSNEIGCKTIAFEPNDEAFTMLKNNLRLNNSNVELFNHCVGSQKGLVQFTSDMGAMNHVLSSKSFNSTEVYIDKIDNICDFDRIALVKIDVEGYELEVIRGMKESLTNSNVKVVIAEINDQLEKYGLKKDDIFDEMKNYGFEPYDFDPINSKLIPIKSCEIEPLNTIFINDLEFVNARIFNSPKIKINNLKL